jgi:hypothetical protein
MSCVESYNFKRQFLFDIDIVNSTHAFSLVIATFIYDEINNI